MCATFTDDDVGKRVETAGGDPLGTVRMTEAETAYVDANEGATGTIRAILEWETDEEIVPMDESAVSEITETAIRLEDERSLPAEPAEEGTDPVIERDESTDARGDSDEQRTLGPQPGAPDEPASSEEGRTGQGLEPSTEGMTESGAERHPDTEEAPPEGDRTVTKDRGEDEDR
ncbi:hypothetical protein CP556_02295 [Natrinema sp. CBA1119]|uniref:hypothetical protein n=1 Tax=Natrinema sp. CBA1119 TaxID=1608465 RepID=UPI000BF66F46|nr:hypothetical protein [Natrinema sp. CBA1119]PGF18193.1 hypothetical protein CP556_02295 [Natrinema sp. CBA1119]